MSLDSQSSQPARLRRQSSPMSTPHSAVKNPGCSLVRNQQMARTDGSEQCSSRTGGLPGSPLEFGGYLGTIPGTARARIVPLPETLKATGIANRPKAAASGIQPSAGRTGELAVVNGIFMGRAADPGGDFAHDCSPPLQFRSYVKPWKPAASRASVIAKRQPLLWHHHGWLDRHAGGNRRAGTAIPLLSFRFHLALGALEGGHRLGKPGR